MVANETRFENSCRERKRQSPALKQKPILEFPVKWRRPFKCKMFASILRWSVGFFQGKKDKDWAIRVEGCGKRRIVRNQDGVED
jgi:hypothetical protein